jgi:hypothetical protein
VRRQSAEFYLLLTLLSFGASVSLTRLFLELTGYPQIGNSELHIAHVLWGGLLLFVGAIFPLVYVNAWAFSASAILTGVGVGLFIDEVGKFITQSNDYFYPAAAPIIYASFLIVVVIYLRLRRPPARDARTELYYALDTLEEVLDRDLEEDERAELEARLRRIARQTDSPDLAHLARELLDFLQSQAVILAPEKKSPWEHAQLWLETQWARTQNWKYTLPLLALGLAALGVIAVARLAALFSTAFTAVTLSDMLLRLADSATIRSLGGLYWLVTRILAEGIAGTALLISAALILLRRAARGLWLAHLSLLVSLIIVNLLVFYFDQFSTILLALLQFGALLATRVLQQKPQGGSHE